jgi:DNA polymerase III subunit gamma/tau
MLSSAAFNAFLKTLEEPPPHAIFILATTEKHKILPTILSRVQKFDFKRIKVDAVADHLKGICEKEGISYEYEGLQLIGLKADGALRDGLSIFDQIVSFSNRNVTYKVVLENLNVLDYGFFFRAVGLMQAADYEGLLLMLNEVIDLGFEVKDFLVGLTEHFRNLLVARTPNTLNLLETSDNVKKQYSEQVDAVSPSWLLNAFNLASSSEQAMRNSANPRLHVELTLMKLAFLGNAIGLAVDQEKKKSNERVSAQNLVASSGASVSAVLPEKKQDSSGTQGGGEGRKSRLLKGPFLIPKSLDDIESDSGKAEGKDGEMVGEAVTSLDSKITISQEAFEAAYSELIETLSSERNFRMVSLLRQDAYRLEHNKWIQTVPNEVAKRQLSEERRALEYMREKLGIPNLILELEIDEQQVAGNDQRPFTTEEKMEKMIEKNPDLRAFMKKFDTFVRYD